MTSHPAITISRSLGSGGTEAGFLVARRLGWHFCDRRILRQAAQAMGLSPSTVSRQEEHYCGFLEKLLNIIAIATPDAPYTPPPDLPVYSKDLFQVEQGIMRQLVESYPSVLVGRASFLVFKDQPDALHVRITADLPFRVQYLVARGKAPDADSAREAIKTSDQERADYLRKLAGVDWQDPRPFHLVLDTSRDGMEGVVDRIVEEARRRFHL
jgi:cytidylate kinase